MSDENEQIIGIADLGAMSQGDGQFFIACPSMNCPSSGKAKDFTP